MRLLQLPDSLPSPWTAPRGHATHLVRLYTLRDSLLEVAAFVFSAYLEACIVSKTYKSVRPADEENFVRLGSSELRRRGLLPEASSEKTFREVVIGKGTGLADDHHGENFRTATLSSTQLRSSNRGCGPKGY